MKILGIHREERLAGKPEADRKIALAVADVLRQRPLVEEVRLIKGEDVDSFLSGSRSAIFSMARGREALHTLSQFTLEIPVVNKPLSVYFCHLRDSLYRNLAKAGIPVPETRKMGSSEVLGQSPPFVLKRMYTHGKADDTIVIRSAQELDAAAKIIEKRDDRFYLVLPFIEGEHFKFYGVGEDVFPLGFAGAAPRMKVDELVDYARAMAKINLLDVYGGDLICTPDHQIYFTDLNDWPSFSPIREEAAQKIADLLERRMAEQHGKTSLR